MKNDPYCTLRQIAEKAGVSRMTVSMALRNHPRISEKTRQRIHAIAEKLGYRPDPLMQRAMSHIRSVKTNIRSVETLGYLVSFPPTRNGWQQQTTNWIEHHEGARQRAAEMGYALEDIWTKEPGMTGKRLTQILLTRNIRGLIIAPFQRVYGHLSLDWQEFAAVIISQVLYSATLDRVTVDSYANQMLLLRHLKRLGYRRIGLVLSTPTLKAINHTYQAALQIYQNGVPQRNRIPTLQFLEFRQEHFAKWFDKYRPDAVVGISPYVRDAIVGCGLKIPDDVGFATLRRLGPTDSCSGIDQQNARIGAHAVELVAARLQRNDLGCNISPKLVCVSGVWEDGSTVRPQGK